MGIIIPPSSKYWDYFLALETDLVGLSRYIEFTCVFWPILISGSIPSLPSRYTEYKTYDIFRSLY